MDLSVYTENSASVLVYLRSPRPLTGANTKLKCVPSSRPAWQPSSVRWAAESRSLWATRQSSSLWWQGRGWTASASCQGQSQTPEVGWDYNITFRIYFFFTLLINVLTKTYLASVNFGSCWFLAFVFVMIPIDSTCRQEDGVFLHSGQ